MHQFHVKPSGPNLGLLLSCPLDGDFAWDVLKKRLLRLFEYFCQKSSRRGTPRTPPGLPRDCLFSHSSLPFPRFLFQVRSVSSGLLTFRFGGSKLGSFPRSVPYRLLVLGFKCAQSRAVSLLLVWGKQARVVSSLSSLPFLRFGLKVHSVFSRLLTFGYTPPPPPLPPPSSPLSLPPARSPFVICSGRPCSMYMWCPHDIGRESWVWDEQEAL